MSMKVKSNCKVNAECYECEMFEEYWPITFINYGMVPERKIISGVKCMKYGHCAQDAEELKKEGFLDDLIFIE